ncbi:carbohydrate ABC transporter substrate-binding protein [Kribbella sandramycini]|uniref:Carbohydrate ABC transporter substrate-binding protein n=1 Tax=Kribbella sandramycini TaxID=60450 RepID=A0A7Y4P1Z0_9ACTN|nr:ABC transporter substrate-binding protein [Kribbella sandramycini]MBB6567074.1 multiple sugar transport system substrate-binding protein [Kribbella sandramycini]NOL44792.1 carbohydrate ABC transporter substrate-binding protein [Kribbella sandramycini]
MQRLARWSVGVAGLLALTLTAACGGSDTGQAVDANELTVQTNWTSGGQESVPLKAALEAFTAETGIKVKLLESGDDLNQVYETALLAKKEADVLLVGLLEKQLDWVKNGAVVPVEQYVDQWGLTIPATALADWKDADGHLRAFPYAGFTWPWWYNKALFDKHGVPLPQTVDELIAAVQKLSAKGVGGVAIGGNDWSGQKIFLQILESYLTPDAAKEIFAKGGLCANPQAMKGVDLFVKLRDAGVFVKGAEGLTADQATALYMSGKAAIAPIGSWSYPTADQAVVGTTTLGGFPVPDGGTYAKPTAYTGSTSAGWWVSPNGQQKLSSVEKLIKFMYRTDVLNSMLKGGVVPAAMDGVDSSAVTVPLLKQSVDALPKAVDFTVMPDLYVPADVGNPMYRATSIAYTAGNDAQKICTTIDAVYQAAK